MSRTLTVYLAADLKKFSGGMKDAQRQAQGFGGTLKNTLGPALIAAGAAAGAFATKLAVDGVKAAIEDEKAVAQLANTLDNLNLAHDTSAVEAYIYELERAYGVADTDLRPAYERLVRSTKDTEEANRALKIAMDISASTGKSLQTVVDTLGRAYDGSTTSLSRLGVGLDQTQLAAMGVNEIMGVLSRNFAGAADQAANTFEGRLTRLKTATDNLAEAFGAGLLDSLNDATSGTQDAVDAMEKLEPLLRKIGETAGESVTDLAYIGSVLGDMAGSIDAVTERGDALGDVLGHVRQSAGLLLDPLGMVADALRAVRGEMLTIADIGGGDFENGVNQANFAVIAANQTYRDAAQRANRLANETRNTTDATQTYTASIGGGGNGGGAIEATEQYTKAQRALIEEYELAGIAFQTTKTELIAQIGVLEEATRAVEDYANSIQQDLLAGIDLGQLYSENFDEQGRQTGKSLVDGFQEQINQATWFGNVLTAIKAQGADQSLIEQIASLGPETGGALGQQMLNEGLVPTMNEQWMGVQETTRNLAMGLVPEFLEAGRLSAIENLNGLATQFADDQKKFKRLGNKLGQQVGDEFSKRMLKEVAAAVREVEAIATAARAEKVAAAQAEQARITEQAVAQAISGLISASDARLGRNVQPVLQ